jgi:predicted PolB exonuclease-like 3'-5' exonuclease
MINVPLEKILFIDIETVGCEVDYDALSKSNPKLASLFQHYESWFKKRFPEDVDADLNTLFSTRAALVPEFSKIVTVCLGIVDQQGKIKTSIFSNENEKTLLVELRKTLFKCGELGYFLCGHNVKNFDIPTIAKRMIINDLMPPKILPTYDTKPWEVRAIDTRDVWQYGQYASISTLDLMCGVLGVESPKSEEMDGSKVHQVYWKEKNIDKINTYCEKDVVQLFDVVKKLINLH